MATRRLAPNSEEFDRLFEGFRHTAFRLETLQRYNSPDQWEQVDAWLAGEPPPDEAVMDWWLGMLHETVPAGKRWQRVHVAVEPLTTYMRWEISAYEEQVDAGEEIGIIPVRAGEWPEELPRHDYWFFDSSLLAKMIYDEDDRFVGIDIDDDPAEIVRHNYWRDAALHLAIPYRDYLDRHGGELRPTG